MANIIVEKRIKASSTDVWGEWLVSTDPAPFADTTLIQYRVNSAETIRMQSRTRVLNTDDWGLWIETTDTAPYVDTELLEYRVVTECVMNDDNESEEAMDYTVGIDDITDNVQTDANYMVTGDGIFDDLMEAVNAHIDAEYQKGRITGPDYSTVYLGALQSVMEQSVKFALEHKNSAYKAQVTEQNIHVLASQEKLFDRQRAGFDDNKAQKDADSRMNAWGITFQDTATEFIPNQIKQAGFDKAFSGVEESYYKPRGC